MLYVGNWLARSRFDEVSGVETEQLSLLVPINRKRYAANPRKIIASFIRPRNFHLHLLDLIGDIPRDQGSEIFTLIAARWIERMKVRWWGRGTTAA